MPFSTRSRGSEKEPASFGRSLRARLKDDVSQIHRAIVAVEAADCAVVVGVGVDRDNYRAKAAEIRIDRADEEWPAARRRSRHAAVEKTKVVPGGSGCSRVEPGVDARIAQHQHVALGIGGKLAELRDCGFEAPGAREGIEYRTVEARPKRKHVNGRKDQECRGRDGCRRLPTH